MNHAALESLKSDELALRLGFLSTPSAVRQFLAKTGEVCAVKRALREGAVTERTLRRFVSDLIKDLRQGERFVHELAMSALAVALERRPTEFVEEFLRDLARLHLAEMSLCVRVAQECARHRLVLSQNRTKVFRIIAPRGTAVLSYRPAVANGRGEMPGAARQVYVCKG